MMPHLKVVDRWEEGTPTTIPSGANVRAHSGGEISDPFFTTVYVRRRLSLSQGTTFGRRQDGLNCTGLPPFGSRALIRAGGGRGVAQFSSDEEYELGLHD